MLLSMSIAGTIVIIFTVLVRSLFYHKLSKKIFQLLWGISIVALLLPFSFSFINEVFANKQVLDIGNQITKISNTAFTAKDISSTGRAIPFSNDKNALLYLYLIVLISFVIYLTVKYIKGKKFIEEAFPLPENELFSGIKEKLNCYNVKFYSSDRIYSPILYGVLKPKILFPRNFDFTDRDSVELILLHELSHIRNGDLIKKYFSLIVLLIHFFNPFVWLMYILFNRDIEAYCDEKVLSYLGLDKKKEYALCLVTYIEQNKRSLIFTQSFAKNALEERILSIMKTSNKKRNMASLIIVVMGCILFVAVKSVGLQANEANKKSIDNSESSTKEKSDKDMIIEHFSNYNDSDIISQTFEDDFDSNSMGTPTIVIGEDESGNKFLQFQLVKGMKNETVGEAKQRLLDQIEKSE